MQVILVDDCSTDSSPRIMQELAADEDVVCFGHDANRGAGVARNTGFRAATGRYTIFFDADDILHPDTLTAVIFALLDATGADLAFMPYRYLRGGNPRATRP